MTTDSTSLFDLARNKLQTSFGGHKDRCSLHRWVLLKNSIINSTSALVSSAVDAVSETQVSSYSEDLDDDDSVSDEVLSSVAGGSVHSFMFPDAGNLVEAGPADAHSSEAQWLDSLLEALGDDDDDDFGPDSDSRTEDEDEQLFSPSASPMSSSDDLLPSMHNHHPFQQHQHHSYFSSLPVSYPIIDPYPPCHPPLASPYAFDSSSLSSLPPPYEDPLPFSDDVDDMPVPDTIEDNTSDDESDSPPTPMGGSRSSLFDVDVLDAASIPLPPDRSRLSHGAAVRVYDQDSSSSSCFGPSFDPLPFSTNDVHSTYNLYSEC
ncbi:hypothetical protein CC1G_03916 [Coprinopsis cinerea okayama7|uniref:Uncharacterized protein n=1 Tax=Coprinopsis cinerea (strain Okayama-7 / 130 / ATCC MYA-4618 / FGSC 9003) TaxID=240176 RepID=A8NH72_COPC7|nr:hypothetical protein CC1G_03916 [Coprinopsis cinerea okayama7\|eukprot:XP_001833699.2 hypothetical protein CC1G_03916 [Coprinopsis cinerea okayama7\